MIYQGFLYRIFAARFYNELTIGPLDDNKTGIAVFEATQEEARDFYDKYDKACSGILNYHLCQWSAIPFLSAL